MLSGSFCGTASPEDLSLSSPWWLQEAALEICLRPPKIWGASI
jgi:hypothetical protein